MRIKSFIPKWAKRKIASILKYDQVKKQDLYWGEDDVIEFWLEGFNESMSAATLHLVGVYDKILHKDPNWHFFYEGHYSLIRCSMKYRDAVKKYLDDNSIEYNWPVKGWTEWSYMTIHYQEDFKVMFHIFSELVIKMIKNNDGKELYMAGDRVAHCFHIMATYLANHDGQLDRFKASSMEPMYWEAEQMARLTTGRAYHIGKIAGEKLANKRHEDNLKEV